MEGRETELDKTLLEAVKDPLTHLVRNSVDHGIETPDARKAAGKAAEGVLTLRARHESGQVVVEVADDGAGIDPVKLGEKAVERGLVTADALARMSPADILQLIFLPGFSTAAAVTNVSGRGVGMDVVKTNIESIGGTIEVESEAGRGTVCRLRIPLTLAIVPALTVECAGDRYAIPQISLQELVCLDAEKAANAVEEVGGAQVYRLRGELLPLVRLTDVLGLTSERHDGHVVIAVLRSEGRRFGLVVDRVINTEEIVVKAVGGQMKAIGLYSGATVLGDGTVALILDVQALARRALRTETTDRQDSQKAAAHAAAASETERQRMLLAAIGGGRRVAIPLDTVTRLEQVRTDAVEKVGNREVVQYRGAILPIVRLDRHLGAYGETDREVLEVIVYADHGRSVAIVVEEILDIVDGEAAVRSDIDDLGLLGSAVLGDKVTELLDVRAAILAADPAFYRPPPPSPRSPTGRRRPASPPLCWRSDVTAPTDIKAPATSGQLATFRLDGDLYGIEVEHVQEVLRSQQLTRVPLAPTRRGRPDQPARPGRDRDRAARAARPPDAARGHRRRRHRRPAARRGGQPARRLDRRRRRRGRQRLRGAAGHARGPGPRPDPRRLQAATASCCWPSTSRRPSAPELTLTQVIDR